MNTVEAESPFAVADEVVFEDTKVKPTKATKGAKTARNDEDEDALPSVEIVILSDTQRTYEAMCKAAQMLAETVGHLPTYDITDATQMAKAKSDLALCRAVAAGTEMAYENWNRPYLDARAENILNRDALVTMARSVGAHINDQIQAEARRKKAEKEARDKAEQARVAAHNEAIADLIELGNMPAASSKDVTEQLARVQADGFLTTRNWQEFDVRAMQEHARTITALQQHLVNAQAREQLAALQAEQAAAEQRRADEALAAENERTRVADLQRRVTDIELTPRTCMGMTADFIAGQIKVLDCLDTGEFAELSEPAGVAKTGALRDMRDMLEAAKLAEESAKRIADQQAEQQRMLDAMTAIQGIQALTTQAVGANVKTLESLLKQAEGADVTEAKFGNMMAVAQTTKDAAVVALGSALSAARLLAEQAAQEATRLAAEQEAEAARVRAEQEAQAARDEAARVAAERVKANADRLLTSLGEIVELARQAGLSGDAIEKAAALIAELSGAQA
jgi:hypothetical protein